MGEASTGNQEAANEKIIGRVKISEYLLLLIVIATVSFLAQAHFVSQIKFIGTSDPAHYAEAAENVIKGKGFSLDYINEYFVKFNSITHPEEYGFPGVSIILIPFILLLGKTAFAVKLPSMIIGIILFPILTYFLGRDFFNEKIGFLAAVSMIFYPQIFPMSFGGERDTMFAFLVVATIYFFYKGIKDEKGEYFYIMGFLLGFSYLVRQPALLLYPVLILAYYIIYRKSISKKSLSNDFIKGLFISGMVFSTWLIRNYLVFGDPFFTVNKYLGWIIGYTTFFEPSAFQIYWESTKPSLSFALKAAGSEKVALSYLFRFFTSLYAQFSKFIVINILAFLGILFLDRKEITKKLSHAVLFIIAFAIIAFAIDKYALLKVTYNLFYQRILLSIPYLGVLFTVFFLFRKEKKENTLFVLFWTAWAFFFSVLWTGGERYWVAIIPFLLIYSWFALEKLLQKLSEKIINPAPTTEQIGKVLFVVLAIFVLLSLPQTFGKFFDKNASFPYKDDDFGNARIQLAEKVKNATTENDVIMGCDVGVFHFYNGRKYLEFPSGDLNSIASVMKTYNISYFTLKGCERRGIDATFYSLLSKDLNSIKVDEKNGNVVAANYNKGIIAKINIPPEYLTAIYIVKFTEVQNEGNIQYALTIEPL